jgi:hypothetical protein
MMWSRSRTIVASCLLSLLLRLAVASSPLCSITTSGSQTCKIYKVEDCQNLVDIPLVRNVQCPAAFNGVRDILKVVSLKAHAPYYDGYMEFYIDDVTLARSNNTCNEKSHISSTSENVTLSASDAVCHALTTLTSPGAKATWLEGALRPLPLIFEKFLAARPGAILKFSRYSPMWNSLINQLGIAPEFRYVIESLMEPIKKIFSSFLAHSKHNDASLKHIALTSGGGGGWGGGIMLSNGQKAVDFGAGGGGDIIIDAQGQETFRAGGGAGSQALEHISKKNDEYIPTLGVSGMSNTMNLLPIYSYSRDSTESGKIKNVTTNCYDSNILGEYVISMQDIYQQLKETYASGGYFGLQGGGGQGASILFNLPGEDVNTFSTGSGFMYQYMFYDPDLVRKILLVPDPYADLYKELGRIYEEASVYASSVCKNNPDPMCECHARYEYILQEAMKYADPLPNWITMNTCNTSSGTDACNKWLTAVS